MAGEIVSRFVSNASSMSGDQPNCVRIGDSENCGHTSSRRQASPNTLLPVSRTEYERRRMPH